MKRTTIALMISAIALSNSNHVWAKSTDTSIIETQAIAQQAPGFFRFNLGKMRITALYDGLATLPASFFKGISSTDVESNWKSTHDYTPNGIEDSVNAYLIDTGNNLIMVDAGGSKCFPNMGELKDNLRQTGYAPNDVDAIVITHFHPDHSCGISDAQGQALYSNATIYVNEKEAAYWLNAEQTAKAPKEVQGMFLMQQKAVAPYQANRRFKTFKAGDELFSGVKAIAAYGHTPGHTIYQFNSEGQTAIFWGDLVHSYQMQLNNPKIAFEYDYDQKQAVSTREQVLAQAAKNLWLVGGSHIPFPGLGHVRPASRGYDWTAVKYQSVLK